MYRVEFTENRAIEYVGWKYDGNFDVYNMPSWEYLKSKNSAICTKEGRKDFYCYEENGLTFGVVRFKELEDCIYVGIALNPKACGKGMGRIVLKTAITDYDNEHSRKKPLKVEVRSWNVRSIKTAEYCGFKKVGTTLCDGREGKFEGVVLLYD